MTWIPITIGTIIAGGVYIGRTLNNRIVSFLKLDCKTKKNFFKRIPYPGNFREKMTISEAALIIGIRASSQKSKVEERYRKLMMMNHPDQGGSPYLAGKIN